MANFSLSWDAYKDNICSGLSALQQNGELVDMTIAADGHYVKVHKMVMSLVSPYIKEIINATACQHPVIFLNKIPYTTLCAILEYVYTGEVTIDKDDLPEIIQAARALSIKGLSEIKYTLKTDDAVSQAMKAGTNKGQMLVKSNQNDKDETVTMENTLDNDQATDVEQAVDDNWQFNEDMEDQNEVIEAEVANVTSQVQDTAIQYSVSSHGALQLILNRYIYYLKYTSRKGSAGHRLWKCASYTRDLRCPATVVTQGGTVIKRMQAHNHPFHDKSILRKVQKNSVFSALDENELQQLVDNKGKVKSPKVVLNKITEDDTIEIN